MQNKLEYISLLLGNDHQQMTLHLEQCLTKKIPNHLCSALLCLTPYRVAKPDPRRKGKGGIQGGLTYVGESQKEGPTVGDRRKEGLTSYPCLQIQDLKERIHTYP